MVFWCFKCYFIILFNYEMIFYIDGFRSKIYFYKKDVIVLNVYYLMIN